MQLEESSIFVAESLAVASSHRKTSVTACELLVAARGIQLPDQEPNPGPLYWEHGVSATGPPGKLLPHVSQLYNLL